MKKVVILGSTGLIGRATLDVVESLPNTFRIVGLACKENVNLLNRQIGTHKPEFVCVYNKALIKKIDFPKAKLLWGVEGMIELAGLDADIVVNALPGSIGLEPTIEVLKNNRILAIANKESLVMAGRIIKRLTRKGHGKLIPVDSEHSALYQLLKCVRRKEIETITITASGGPFRGYSKRAMEGVKLEEALNHPTWKMGKKVTLDSATLMNKGLEVIEARWLFDIEPERIKVLIHPESIVHGMIKLTDGSLFTYLSSPDMKIPIAYALNEGARYPLPVRTMDLEHARRLTFYPPDLKRFPLLRMAYEALDSGDAAVVTMNAANEVAAKAFMEGRIKFTDIASIVEDTVGHHSGPDRINDIETVKNVHDRGWKHAEEILRNRYA